MTSTDLNPNDKNQTTPTEGIIKPPAVGYSRSRPDLNRWLLNISERFSQIHSLNELTRLFAEEMQVIFPYATLMLFTPNIRTGQLQREEVVQSLNEGSEIGLALTADRIRAINDAFRTRRPRMENRISLRSLGIDSLGKYQVGHLLIIPLSGAIAPQGVVTISRITEPEFEQVEYEWAQIAFNLSALVVQNRQMDVTLQTTSGMFSNLPAINQSLNRPMSLNDIVETIGHAGQSISQADGIAVFYRNPTNGACHLWSGGLSGYCLNQVMKDIQIRYSKTTEPVYVEDIHTITPQTGSLNTAQAEGFISYSILPLVYDRQSIATIECLYKSRHFWTQAEKDSLAIFTHHAVLALENTRLYEEVEEIYMQTVLTLAKTLDARDAYTGEHSQRLAELAEKTARHFKLSQDEIDVIKWAAMLHDIGKIGVPDSILRKPGPLSEDEWAIMKRHPVVGAEIIAPLKKLRRVTPLIRYHQEKMDGTGYPDGLHGDQIPLGARILTVVDAFGAMTSERVYRKARSPKEAEEELRRCSGAHFDQAVVDVFCRVLNHDPTLDVI